MANEVRIKITADTRNADQAVRGFRQRLAGVGDTARRMRLPLLALTGAVAGLGATGVKAASDLVEQMNRANVVFAGSIGIVKDFAETSAATFRLTKREAFEYSSVLGRIMQASGFTARESATMSVELLKVAGDLSSISNTPMPRVLAAIQSGLVGEVEPLRRFGVLLSQATLEAKAAELGIAGLGDELTEAQKVTARQAVIIEALSFAQGDAAKTANTAAGQMAQLRVQQENLRAEIGQFLLPVTTKLLGGINRLMQAFQNLTAPVQAAIVGAAVFAGGLAVVGLVLPFLISGFGVLATMIGALLSPIGLVVVAIGALVVGSLFALTRWREGTKKTVDAIIQGFFNVVRFMGSVFTVIWTSGLRSVVAVLSDVVGLIAGLLKEWVLVHLRLLEWIGDRFVGDMTDHFGTIVTVVGKALEGLGDIIAGSLNMILEKLQDFAQRMPFKPAWVKALIDLEPFEFEWGNAAESIVGKMQGMAAGVTDAVGKAADFLEGFDVGELVAEGFAAFDSIVKNMDAILVEAMDTVREFASQGIDTAGDSLDAFMEKMRGFATGIAEGGKELDALAEPLDKIADGLDKIGESAANATDKVTEFARGAMPPLADFFTRLTPAQRAQREATEFAGGRITAVGGGVWNVEDVRREVRRRMLESGFPVADFGHGGRVPGPIGAPFPAVLHGGEVVSRGGGDINVTVIVEGDVNGEMDFERSVRRAMSDAGLLGVG